MVGALVCLVSAGSKDWDVMAGIGGVLFLLISRIQGC